MDIERFLDSVVVEKIIIDECQKEIDFFPSIKADIKKENGNDHVYPFRIKKTSVGGLMSVNNKISTCDQPPINPVDMNTECMPPPLIYSGNSTNNHKSGNSTNNYHFDGGCDAVESGYQSCFKSCISAGLPPPLVPISRTKQPEKQFNGYDNLNLTFSGIKSPDLHTTIPPPPPPLMHPGNDSGKYFDGINGYLISASEASNVYKNRSISGGLDTVYAPSLPNGSVVASIPINSTIDQFHSNLKENTLTETHKITDVPAISSHKDTVTCTIKPEQDNGTTLNSCSKISSIKERQLDLDKNSSTETVATPSISEDFVPEESLIISPIKIKMDGSIINSYESTDNNITKAPTKVDKKGVIPTNVAAKKKSHIIPAEQNKSSDYIGKILDKTEGSGTVQSKTRADTIKSKGKNTENKIHHSIDELTRNPNSHYAFDSNKEVSKIKEEKIDNVACIASLKGIHSFFIKMEDYREIESSSISLKNTTWVDDGESVDERGSVNDGGPVNDGESVDEGESVDDGESVKGGQSVYNGESFDKGGSVDDRESVNDVEPDNDGDSVDDSAEPVKKKRAVRTDKDIQCPVTSSENDTDSDNEQVVPRLDTTIEKIECKECGKDFKTRRNLKRHLYLHTGLRPYECSTCKKTFTTSSYLRCHEKMHSGKRPFKCDTCQATFYWQQCYRKHLLCHTNLKPFKCSICSKYFKRQTTLTEHMKNTHRDVKLECETCGKLFLHQKSLKAHLKLHTGIGLYACEICDKEFNTTAGLKNHLSMHSGTKPYKCEYCDAMFRSKCNMETHQRTHTKERPYTCTICDSKFRSSSSLGRHKVVHTGEKPYKCEICKTTFNQSCSVKRHMLQVHNMKSYKCPKCKRIFQSEKILSEHLEKEHKIKLRHNVRIMRNNSGDVPKNNSGYSL